MSLDLSQNINLYLAILTTIISIILLLRVNRMGRNNRYMSKTLRRLKYEINKMQVTDSKLLKSLTDEEVEVHSWFEEDEYKIRKKQEKKAFRKEKRQKIIQDLRSKLPDDLEYFAGEQILDKFGIGAFLIGLALFINISMKLDWINDFGRLFFGIILTIIFLVTGYLLRKKFVHFSNILMGGGIASFIFAIFSAYYQYHLFPLVIWILITGFVIGATIMISVSVKRHEIAIITFIAAYLAPFTVSFIKSDYIVLFSYLTLLNIAILIYDYYQKSIVINLLSFGFTFITYGIWLVSKIYFFHEEIPYLGSFLFLTLFYIMFIMMIIINNLREGKEFHKLDFSIMMSAKAIFLSVGLIIIKQTGVAYQGLFVGLIGIINYIFYLALYNKKNFDRRILNQFLALSIMFFALVIPVEFYGKTITLVWSLQAIVLMFISVKSDIESMRMSSLMITILMVGSLFISMYDDYISTTGTLEYIQPFLNIGFFTGVFAIVSMIAIIFLLPNDGDTFFIKKILKVKHYKAFLGLSLVIISYFTFFLEIKTAAIQHFDSMDTVDTVVSIYNLSFIALASIPIFIKKLKPLEYITIGVAIAASFIYIFAYSHIYINLRNEFLLSTKVTKGQFNIHYWAALMIIFAVFSAIKHLKVAFENQSIKSYFVTVLLVFLAIYIISAEVTTFYVVKLYEPHLLIQDIVKRMHHFAYSIAWALTSLFFIILGVKYKISEIKIVAMFLYGITLAKIILFDFWTATNQDLMISFVVMGIVMLISSFLFQYAKRRQISN